MTEILSKQSSNRAGLEAPALLFVTGSLLAVTIILSRLATAQGAPMLWFLAVVMGGAGLMLLSVTALTGQAKGDGNRRLIYSIGAGAFQALAMARAYLSVAHVGVGYISLAFAFALFQVKGARKANMTARLRVRSWPKAAISQP